MKRKKSRHPLNFLKKKRVIFSALLLILFFFFHSCMNFRTSDKKTQAYFEEAGLESRITYIQPPGNNYKVRTVSTGQTKNQTVIFIHGAPGSGDAFYEYLKDTSLLKKSRLITYDRPGYGYSGFGRAMTGIEEQSEILADLITRYDVRHVILVGHSYGAPIAVYATLLSDRIDAVIMLAPAIDPEHEKYFWIGNLVRWKLTRWLVPRSWRVSADEKYTHEAELIKLKDRWKEVAVPVLCLQGNKDRLVPYENLAFCKKHFDPQYFTGITLEEEDHFIPWTRKELVIEEIMKFLKK